MLSHRTVAVRLALLLVGLPMPVAAQAVGSDLGVNAARLSMGVDSLAIFLIRNGDTIRTGTVWDELGIVEDDHGAQLQRVYRSADRVMGIRVDTVVDAFPSLTPARYHSRSSNGREHLEYTGTHVRGWVLLANGDTVSVETALPETTFSSASFDLVLRAAPLTDGWEAEIPVFLTSTRTVVPLHARVAGSELIGAQACWRVEANFAGSAVTFWIAENSRELCRQVMHLRPGVQIMFGAFPRSGPDGSHRANNG